MSTLMEYLNPFSEYEEEGEEEDTDSDEEANYGVTEEHEESWDATRKKWKESERPVTSKQTAGPKGDASYRYQTSGSPVTPVASTKVLKPSPTSKPLTSNSHIVSEPASGSRTRDKRTSDSAASDAPTSDSHISDSPVSNLRISDAPTSTHRTSGSAATRSNRARQSRSGLDGLRDAIDAAEHAAAKKSAFYGMRSPSGHLLPPKESRHPSRQSNSTAVAGRRASVAEVKAALRANAQAEVRRINNMPSPTPKELEFELRRPHRSAWQREGIQPKSHDVWRSPATGQRTNAEPKSRDLSRPRQAKEAKANMVEMSGMVNQVVDVVCKEDLRNIISHYVNEQVSDTDPLGVGRLALALRRCHEARNTSEVERKPLHGARIDADFNLRPRDCESTNTMELMESAKERIELLSKQVVECSEREGLVRKNLEKAQNELLLLQSTAHDQQNPAHATRNANISTNNLNNAEPTRGRSVDSPSRSSTALEKDRPAADKIPSINEKAEDKMSPQRTREHIEAAGERDGTGEVAFSFRPSRETGSSQVNAESSRGLASAVQTPRGSDAPHECADEERDSLENFETAVRTMKDRLGELTNLVNLTLETGGHTPESGEPTSGTMEDLEVCKRSLKVVLDAHLNSMEVVDAMKNKLFQAYVKGEDLEHDRKKLTKDHAQAMRSPSPDGINARACRPHNAGPLLHSPRHADTAVGTASTRARSLSPAVVAKSAAPHSPCVSANVPSAHVPSSRSRSTPPPPSRHNLSAVPVLSSNAKPSPVAAASFDVPNRLVSPTVAPARDVLSRPNPPENRTLSPSQRLPCLASLRKSSPRGVGTAPPFPDIRGARGARNARQVSRSASPGCAEATSSCLRQVARDDASNNLYIPPRKQCVDGNAPPNTDDPAPVRKEWQVLAPSVGATDRQRGLLTPSPRGEGVAGGGGRVAGSRDGTPGLSASLPGVNGGVGSFTPGGPGFCADVHSRCGVNDFGSSGHFDLHYAPLEPPPRGAYKAPSTLDAPCLQQTPCTAPRVLCQPNTLRDSSLVRPFRDGHTGQRDEKPRHPTSRTPSGINEKQKLLPSPRVTGQKHCPSALDRLTLRAEFSDVGTPSVQKTSTAATNFSRIPQKQAGGPALAPVAVGERNALRSKSPKDAKGAVFSGERLGAPRQEADTVKCGTPLTALRPCERIAEACAAYGSEGKVERGASRAEKELHENSRMSPPVLSRTPSAKKIPAPAHATQVFGTSNPRAQPYMQLAASGEEQNEDGSGETLLTPDFGQLQRRRGVQGNVRATESVDPLGPSPRPVERLSPSRLDNTRVSKCATAPHLVVAKRLHDEQRVPLHAAPRSDLAALHRNYNSLHKVPPALVSGAANVGERNAGNRAAAGFLGQPVEVETKSRIKRHEFPQPSRDMDAEKRRARRTIESGTALAHAHRSHPLPQSPSTPITATRDELNDAPLATHPTVAHGVRHHPTESVPAFDASSDTKEETATKTTALTRSRSHRTAMLKAAILSGDSSVALSDLSYVIERLSQSRGTGVILLPEFESHQTDFDLENWATTPKPSIGRLTTDTPVTVPVSSFSSEFVARPPATDVDIEVADITRKERAEPAPPAHGTEISRRYLATGIQTSHNVLSSSAATSGDPATTLSSKGMSQMAACVTASTAARPEVPPSPIICASAGEPTLFIPPPNQGHAASSVNPHTYSRPASSVTARLAPASTLEHPLSVDRHFMQTPLVGTGSAVAANPALHDVHLLDTSGVHREHTVAAQWLNPGLPDDHITRIGGGGVAQPETRCRQAHGNGTPEPMTAYNDTSHSGRPQDRLPPGVYNALAQLGILKALGIRAPDEVARDREILAGSYGRFTQSASPHSQEPMPGRAEMCQATPDHLQVPMAAGQYAEEFQYAPAGAQYPPVSRYAPSPDATPKHGTTSAATTYDIPGASPRENFDARAQRNQSERAPSAASHAVKSSLDGTRLYQNLSQGPGGALLPPFEPNVLSPRSVTLSACTGVSEAWSPSLLGIRVSGRSSISAKHSAAHSDGRTTCQTDNEQANIVGLLASRPPGLRGRVAQPQSEWVLMGNDGSETHQNVPVKHGSQKQDPFGEAARGASIASSAESLLEMLAPPHHVGHHGVGHPSDRRTEGSRYPVSDKSWALAGDHIQGPSDASPPDLSASMPNVDASVENAMIDRNDVTMDGNRSRAVTFGREAHCEQSPYNANDDRSTKAVTFGGETEGRLFAASHRAVSQGHLTTGLAVGEYSDPHEKPSTDNHLPPTLGATLGHHAESSPDDGWRYSHAVDNTSREERTSRPSATEAVSQDLTPKGGAGHDLASGAIGSMDSGRVTMSEKSRTVVDDWRREDQAAVEEDASRNYYRSSTQSALSRDNSSRLKIGRPSTDEESFGGSSSQSDFLAGEELTH